MKMFSNCSIEDFSRFISKQKSQCLQNQPHLEPSYKQDAVCGNGILEEGETCDCGSEEVSAPARTVCYGCSRVLVFGVLHGFFLLFPPRIFRQRYRDHDKQTRAVQCCGFSVL